MGETQYIDGEYSAYLPPEDTQEWCEDCETPRSVVGTREEQAGYEEQTRTYQITELSCGHEIVAKRR